MLTDRHNVALVATTIEKKTKEGRQNDQVHDRVLCRHQAHKLERRVILATAHVTHFSAGQGQVVRREPDRERNNQRPENEFDVFVVTI